MNIIRHRLFIGAIAAIVMSMLVSCSIFRKDDGGYYQKDGPPKTGSDVRNVPDAVPRWEPLSKTGNKPYRALGKTYRPMTSADGFKQRGVASWYGRQFHGRRTSSGERYDMYKMTAAHPTLPLPSYVKVRNRDNGRIIIVRVNDRGPFLKGRIIDLSYAAASKLGIVGKGVGRVEIETITPGRRYSQPIGATTIPVSSSEPVAGEPLVQTGGPSAIQTAASSANDKVYLQAGAFSNIKNAEFLKMRLIQAGMSRVVIMPADHNGAKIYRVRIGPLASLAQADTQLPRLRNLISADPRLVVE